MIVSSNGEVLVRGEETGVYTEFIRIIRSFYMNNRFTEEQILEAVRVAGLSNEELVSEIFEGDENVC